MTTIGYRFVSHLLLHHYNLESECKKIEYYQFNRMK